MNTKQKKYTAFMESVCKQFSCPEMLPALNAGFKAFCEATEDENGGPISEPMGGSPELGKICSYYEHNDGMGIINVMNANAPLSELSKTKTDLEEFSQKSPNACRVMSDIKKYVMVSLKDEITDTKMQYVNPLSFDEDETGNVYGFHASLFGEDHMICWIPNGLNRSEYGPEVNDRM
jgi:hypothetical protein